ncbi:MAG: choice-of-anchor D domain-containing protein, partial [Ignavibacteriae bacterium]|nr:choice-of-anchor D domain-containing protein [Ignavibacteriota bacterium]
GSNSYIHTPYRLSGSMNFAPSQSFTVQVWFNTTQHDSGVMIGRGLTASPGFALRIFNGHVQAVIGDSPDHSKLIYLTTAQADYNDGQWHCATFIRDRSQTKLFLYVDEQQGAAAADVLTTSLFSDRPLTLGRGENLTQPMFYRGFLDEVCITTSAHHPSSFAAASILVQPMELSFGDISVGGSKTKTLTISNVGTSDVLRISGITSTNARFTVNTASFDLAPKNSRTLQVTYSPTLASVDTGSLSVACNDPSRALARMSLRGQGFVASDAPHIIAIDDVPNDQGKQVRVAWYRSIHDVNGDSVNIARYSILRSTDPTHLQWSPVASVPAERFDQYSCVAPTLFDSSQNTGMLWSAYKVVAQSANGKQVFYSEPDSGYSTDNQPPFAPINLSAGVVAGRISLTWDRPLDPDVKFFEVYRSTSPYVFPTTENRIGSSDEIRFVDETAIWNTMYYYCIASFDTGGNQSGSSNQTQIMLTGVKGKGLPTAYRLYQDYPNLFNPTSIIRYDVPRGGHISIKLYDMLGRRTATLVDETKSPGSYEASIRVSGLSSGVYLCRMQAGTYVEAKKVVLVK